MHTLASSSEDGLKTWTYGAPGSSLSASAIAPRSQLRGGAGGAAQCARFNHNGQVLVGAGAAGVTPGGEAAANLTAIGGGGAAKTSKAPLAALARPASAAGRRAAGSRQQHDPARRGACAACEGVSGGGARVSGTTGV